MKLLSVDSIEEARVKLLDCVQGRLPGVERVSLFDAPGRILAEDVYCSGALPEFRRSTVDGYALKAADAAGAGESLPVFLSLAGAVEMGKPALIDIGPGQCAYVPTGGMIPRGADAVVMVEYCEPFDEKSLAVYQPAAPGGNVVQIGEDVQAGDILCRRGVRIRPQEAGALAAVGIAELPVFLPPVLTLISTGDELVSPGDKPQEGQIRDINTHALRALAVRSGYRVAAEFVIGDNEDLLEKTIRGALASSDVVAVSGGSSQGKKDISAEVLSRFSPPGLFCHGLAIKPGKPTILGYEEASGTILAGLPGHPVSAMMVFQTLFAWLFQTLTFQSPPFPLPARIACNIPGSPGKTTYQAVTLRRLKNSYAADPVFGKSGMISSLTRADGYIIMDRNCEGLQKDEIVLVYLL
jgi:molybdopterin molybdotransferase